MVAQTVSMCIVALLLISGGACGGYALRMLHERKTDLWRSGYETGYTDGYTDGYRSEMDE